MIFFSLNSANAQGQERLSDPQVKEAEAFDKAFWQAQKFKNTERPEQALQAFLRCDSIEPERAVILSEISLLHHELMRPADAMDFAEQALKANDVQAWHFKQAARVYTELKVYERAAEILEELNERKPEVIETLYALIGIYLQEGKLEEAIDGLNRLEKIRGVEAEISLQKKQIFLEQGALDKALNELDKLIDAFPHNFDFQLEKAEVLQANDRPDEAREIWLEIVNIYPVQAVANLRLARSYQESGEIEKAYTYLKVAMASQELNMDDKVAVLLNIYQRSQADTSLLPKAYELIDAAVSSAPSEPRPLSVKGDFLLREGRLEEAHNAFLKATELPEGNRFPIWQQMLIINTELGQWSRAHEEAKTAIDLFPAQPFPYLIYGLSFLQKNEAEKAVEWLESGKDLAFGNRPLQGQFYSYLAQAFHELEQHDESDEAFRKALRIQPDNPTDLNNFAYYLSVRNTNLKEALEMTEKCNRLMPGNPVFLDTWAWVLFRLKRYDEALEKVNRALELSQSPQAELLDHKGDILYHLNRVEEAVDMWQQALDLGGGNDTLLRKKISKRSWYE